MTNLRSLRTRILLLLLAGLVPVFVLAVAWSTERDRAFRRFQYAAAAASIDAASQRLGRVIDRASALRAALEARSGDVCVGLGQDVAGTAGFDAIWLAPRDGAACRLGGAAEAPPAEPLENALRAAVAGGADPAYANDGDLGGRLVVGLRVGRDDSLLVLRLARPETDRILDPQATPFLQAVALYTGGQAVAERHAPGAPGPWLPAAGLPAPRGQVDLDRQDGSVANYFTMPIDPQGRVMLLGLGARPFLGTDQWPLRTTIAQLAAIVLATLAGALWAIDRSVLRWINYLRRIAVAHSRGHHSVRAKRLAWIPRELAELGESLNLMANDAARRVALLRESATDKTALLLELHHRVKNNFQVITSLLSLLRQEMPPSRREEVRFVEDFVRAMAVAYRVAYDSGDVTGVILQDLLRSVVEALRDLAGTSPERIALHVQDEPIWIDLDRAISLGLYLAVTLPPYLDTGLGDPTARAAISVMQEGVCLRATIGGVVPLRLDEPPLRRRLRNAYLRQLKATVDPSPAWPDMVIRIPLDDDRGLHRLAALSASVAPAQPEPVDPLAVAEGCALAAAGAGITLSGQGFDLRYRWLRGADLFGHPAQAVIGRAESDFLPPATASALNRLKLQVLADGEPAQTIMHLAEPAPERWFAIHVQALSNGSGRITGVLTACCDVTGYKATERRVTLLMWEMAHRSKNILAVTEAMARQSLGYATSLEDFSERFSARLHSLAGSHDLLTRRDWESARLGDLLRSQLGHYLQGDPPQIVIDGPEVSLTATAIPYLGLALHELSTNAAKHGALSVAQGRVTISWRLYRDETGLERLQLGWVERGGPPVVPPTRRGFGTDVTRRIVSRALHGEVTLDFAQSGVVWRLDAAAANLAVPTG